MCASPMTSAATSSTTASGTSLGLVQRQMYVAPSAVAATDLPDLFKGDQASLPEAIAGLELVALIDAWHDNTEWRVAVVLSGD